MPSFYDGKRFFLTYPTCTRTPQELVAYLQGKAPVRSYLVARELHQDGQPHLHACVEFKTHQRKAVDWLDDFGVHPNKQDPRKWAACKQYCKKDGDFLEGPEDEPEDNLQETLAQMDTEEQWMEYCLTKKITFQYAQWFWTRMRQDDCTILGDEHEGRICDQLKELKYVDSTQTWILRGESGTGKTTWAKINMPKPCLFVRHIDSLKKFRPGFHKSIIFDDVHFVHYPRTSQIHLVDYHNASDIHCRNTCAHIPAGIHKVFTCNEWPLLIDDPAIRRRIKLFTIKNFP